MPRPIDLFLVILAAALFFASFLLESRGMLQETQIARWAAFIILFIAATLRFQDRSR